MSIKIFEDQIRIKMYLETLEKEMNSCVSILNNLIETRGFKNFFDKRYGQTNFTKGITCNRSH